MQEDQRWITLKFQEKQIRKFDSALAHAAQPQDNGFVCYLANDIMNAMDRSRYKNVYSQLTDDHIVTIEEREQYRIKTYKDYKGLPRLDNKINLLKPLGLKRILSQCRSPKSIELAKFFNIDIHDAKYCAKETTFINQIIAAIDGNIEYTLQYRVPDTTYRIDMYLPDYNIAIECDENGHADRDPEYEAVREQEIKNKLKCGFIRFNPDSPNFNIFSVVNEIYRQTLMLI